MKATYVTYRVFPHISPPSRGCNFKSVANFTELLVLCTKLEHGESNELSFVKFDSIAQKLLTLITVIRKISKNAWWYAMRNSTTVRTSYHVPVCVQHKGRYALSWRRRRRRRRKSSWRNRKHHVWPHKNSLARARALKVGSNMQLGEAVPVVPSILKSVA